MERSFGDTIKKLRESKNLTLREVAYHLNIDTSMLGKLEKNTRKPTFKLIDQIAFFYDVSIKDLRIMYLSDMIVYHLINEEDYPEEVLELAKTKLIYRKVIKNKE